MNIDEQTTVTYLLDQALKDKLIAIAAASERSMSAMIRWLIAQEYERQFPTPTPEVKK